MSEQILSLSPVSIALIPVVLAVTQIVKSFLSDSRLVPLISIILGVAASFAVPHTDAAFYVALQGVLIGLSASGLFSGVKATTAS